MRGSVRTAIVWTACVTVLGGLLGATVTGPASALEPRLASSSDPSPYAVPLSALGGQSLAQYLAVHRAGDRRLTLGY